MGEEKKRFAIIIIPLVVVAFLLFLVLNLQEVNPREIQVGIFYYVWYNNATEVSWNRLKILDQPVLGCYNSCDPTIIRQHLLWLQEMDVDFALISWWGFYDDYGKFTDEASKQVFETARSIDSTLKFAIMVEPFSMTGDSYDYSEIYSRIYETFADPYSDLYFNFSGKPLICFFNNENLTRNGFFPQDMESRFSAISVGQQSYTQWIYTDLNKYDQAAHEPRGEFSVTPRFDDSRFRAPACIVDPNLTEGSYDREWESVRKNQHSDDIFMERVC